MKKLFLIGQVLVLCFNSNAINIPYFFVKNRGQFENKISYNLKTPGSSVFFLEDRFIYQFTKTNNKNISDTNLLQYENIEVKFINSFAKAFFSEEGKLQSKTNYLLGNDRTKWITDVQNFQTLVYNDIYNGINLKYYSENNELKYDFVINPNGNINNIKLEFNGQQNIQLKNGKLEITGKYNKLIENIPLAYQIINGKKVIVKVDYTLKDNYVGFSCVVYNKSFPLVVDPILFYSTYVGGSGDETYVLGNIRRDNFGNIYTGGYTNSINFPVTAGAYSSGYNGGSYDACVFKLNSTGTGLIYSTFIGGSDFDRINDVLLDTNTYELYICGDSFSANFPSTSGVYQPANASTTGGSGGDAFVGRLTPSGNSLVFSTFVGGTNDDHAAAMVFDIQHNLWCTGSSQSASFPVTSGTYDVSWNGSFDCIIFKMDDIGTTLLTSTFIGGTQSDAGGAIAIDNNYNVYVAVHSQGGFPTTAGAFDVTYNGGTYDLVAIKLNSTLSTLIYSTYLGGSGDDNIRHDLHVDNLGNFMFSGQASLGFPTTAGAYDQTYNGGNSDVFITEVNATGTALNFSTLVGASGDDAACMCYKNHNKNIVVTGYCSNNYPVTPCCYDPTYNGGNSDVFVSIFDATGSNLLYSTYIGGSGDDQGMAITCDYDTVYITGQTGSTNFPTTTGAYDVTYNGGTWDYFALKIYLGIQPPVSNFNITSNVCSLSCNLTNTSTNAITYSWLFGDGGTSTLVNPTYTYSAAGQYSISLVANPGTSCADTSTSVITVNSGAIAQFSVTQIACGKNVSINNASINTTNNSWSFGDGTNANTLNPINHTFPSAGTYTITLIADTNSICADTLQKVITITTPPTSSFSVAINICSMSCSLINLSSGATNYIWLYGDGGTSTMVNPTYTYNTAGQYTISLIANSGGVCIDTSINVITFNAAPKAQFTIAKNNCTENVTINNTSSNAINYTWSFGDGNVSTTSNPTHSYSIVGTYSIVLIAASQNGCTDTLKQNVAFLNNLPISSFTLPPLGCIGSFDFTNNSTNAQNFIWNFGDGSSISNLATPIHNYTVAGTYTAQLIAENQTCNNYDTSYQTITIQPKPQVNLGKDTSLCTNAGVVFTLNAGNAGATYQWSNGQTTQTISVSYTEAYYVIVTKGGCSNSDTINIYSPTFDFGGDTLFCGKENITLQPINLNITPSSYLWSTGENSSSITVSEEETYWLQISQGSCAVRKYIHIVGGYDSGMLYIPNTFTPNQDNLNEIFKPIGTDITGFDMKIFNRWGQKIFETTDINTGWNGIYKGQDAEQGVYVWLINYTTSCSKAPIRKSGVITIIR